MAKKKEPFILSTEDKNCYNARVKSLGIRLAKFLANPIMLYMHRRGEVIGIWENVQLVEGQLLGDPLFDMEDPFAANIGRKVEKGFIRAASISIELISYHFEKEGDIEILVIDECELIEVSIVDIPGNRSAVRLFKGETEIDLSKGFMSLKAEMGEITINESPKPTSTNMDLKAMAKILGLPESATEDEVKAAMQLAQQASTDLAALKQKQKGDQKARAVSLFDTAVSEKRIAATEKEAFLKLADTDYELFERTLKALPAPVSLKGVVTGQVQLPAGITLSEDRKKWTFEDWRKNDSSGLIKLQKSDWDTFSALFEAEYGEKPEKD